MISVYARQEGWENSPAGWPQQSGNRLMLAQGVAEAGTSSPVARAVAEPLDRCDACAYGEDAGREVV
jgi:hypothetical protein